MINYWIQNIEGLVEQLLINGTQFLNSIEGYEYGKFVHILDLEENKIDINCLSTSTNCSVTYSL